MRKGYDNETKFVIKQTFCETTQHPTLELKHAERQDERA